MANTTSPYGSYKVSQYSECTDAVHTQWLFPCILEHHQKLYFFGGNMFMAFELWVTSSLLQE